METLMVIVGYTLLTKGRRNKPVKVNDKNPAASIESIEALDQLANFFSNLFEETQMTDVDEIINAINKAETEEESVNQQIKDTNKEIELLEQSIADEEEKDVRIEAIDARRDGKT